MHWLGIDPELRVIHSEQSEVALVAHGQNASFVLDGASVLSDLDEGAIFDDVSAGQDNHFTVEVDEESGPRALPRRILLKRKLEIGPLIRVEDFQLLFFPGEKKKKKKKKKIKSKSESKKQ